MMESQAFTGAAPKNIEDSTWRKKYLTSSRSVTKVTVWAGSLIFLLLSLSVQIFWWLFCKPLMSLLFYFRYFTWSRLSLFWSSVWNIFCGSGLRTIYILIKASSAPGCGFWSPSTALSTCWQFYPFSSCPAWSSSGCCGWRGSSICSAWMHGMIPSMSSLRYCMKNAIRSFPPCSSYWSWCSPAVCACTAWNMIPSRKYSAMPSAASGGACQRCSP